MARLKIELHLPFLVIGVEDMRIKWRERRTRSRVGIPGSSSLAPTPTGRFLSVRDGSAVAYRETIEGVVSGLAPGAEAWVIVYPAGEGAYWPQYGVPVGQSAFKTPTQFGRSETKDVGEKFILLLVAASQNASNLFHGFRAKNATNGLSILPSDTQTLVRVLVRRK